MAAHTYLRQIMKALDVTIVELATIVSLCYNIPAVLWDPCSMAAPVCHQLIHWSFHLTLANPLELVTQKRWLFHNMQRLDQLLAATATHWGRQGGSPLPPTQIALLQSSTCHLCK